MHSIFPRGALLLAVLSIVASSEGGELRQTALFVAGQGGYHTYRIPSLIATQRGTLLAFCEGRVRGAGDSGAIHLLVRRSLDGGETWHEPTLVWADGDNTCGNPCPVVDRRTGAIVLLMTHNLGSDTERHIVAGTGKGSRTVWLTRSADDGATWAKPVEITRTVKAADWTWYATGPGIGIQTRSGRLVIPCNHYVAGSQEKRAHVIWSDDAGQTWHTGGVVGPHCNESQVVELADGTLLLNVRSYRGNNRRLVAISKDGGTSWSPPVEDEALVEPVCQASILRCPQGILFANPASTKRERLTIRLSRDEGRTWPVARTLYAGPAAYSCLAMLPNGDVGCLYERGERQPYETLTLARFSLDWLTAGP